jgi:putative membrane protein
MKLEHGILLALTLIGLVVSGINPHDRATWLMETLPVMLVIPLLAVTYRRFPLTPLLYRLIFLHACVLMLGGHYTYAEVPLGHWVRDALGLERNHYDRLGHLMQGFVPAIAAREVLLRKSPLKPGAWLFVVSVCIPLAFSAFYEMLEWWAAEIMGQGADAFLGTQGDQWDTQWDMFLCMVGAVTALLLLGRVHNKQITRPAKAGDEDRGRTTESTQTSTEQA